jgi:hypothetical protein
MTNSTELTFLEYYNLVYNFNSKLEHSHEDAQIYLAQLEIGISSKNPAIALWCRNSQYIFADID